MTILKALPVIAGIAMVVTAGPSLAIAGSLRDVKEVEQGLFVIAAGDMIADNCATIEPRMFKAYTFAKGLERVANKAGYSYKEIEAYVTDKEEKKRVKAIARNYLVGQGVNLDDPQSYCTAGIAEIERNSQIGVLLRVK
ncbi:DUF5333 domain-containing protein [Actibacterium sp. XHP0104]|uniref:DUF5333 domain-containing protein n=1 Tax=Actibacterium sp. XHP0104 TaxID=2984335 RepID=UPI0021E77BD8|nr:DUF5333 domain-containing protein [Actibacterium sp. XHP0104]MCV2880690.1 DUF5333 domain-containing protein [Actibacterium sp. XHP0104]